MGGVRKFKRTDGTPSKMFTLKLKLSNGEERGTTLNWTNVKLLVEAFGDDTLAWVGKEVRAWKTKSEKAKGGFTFLYVPTDWERDDTGEWIKSLSEEPTMDEEDIPFP